MVAAASFASEARIEFAKLVGNGTRNAQRHRAVSDRIPSEPIADPVDGTVGRPTCHAYFGAGAARFILKSKREFQLDIPVAPPSADAAG